MKYMKWIDTIFQSSSGKTEQFKSFVRDIRSDIKTIVEDAGCILENISVGHFEISGFVSYNNKYAYFSIPDVRFNKDSWHSRILVRTAVGVKDYTGGNNNYASFDNLGNKLIEILK